MTTKQSEIGTEESWRAIRELIRCTMQRNNRRQKDIDARLRDFRFMYYFSARDFMERMLLVADEFESEHDRVALVDYATHVYETEIAPVVATYPEARAARETGKRHWWTWGRS